MVSGPEYIVEPPPIIDTEPGGHISISETVYPNYLAPQNSPETFWFTIHILNQGTSTVHMTEFGSCLPEHFTYFSPETQGVTGVTDLYLGGSETSVDKQDSTLLTAEEMNDPALNPEFIQTKTINNPYCPADRWQIRWKFKKDVKIFSGDTAKITYKATATQLLPGVHCNQVFVEPNPSSYNGYVTNNACNLVAAWPEWNITASADGTTAEVRAELQHPDEWEEAVTIKSWQVGGGSPAEPLVNGVHVGDLEGNGWAPKGKPGFWSARARIYVHDANHDPVGGAVVKGVFHQTELGFVSEEFSCTSSLGICDIVNDRGLSELQTTALFEVREITLEPMNYDLTSNHDQDGFDSDGRILEIIYK